MYISNEPVSEQKIQNIHFNEIKKNAIKQCFTHCVTHSPKVRIRIQIQIQLQNQISMVTEFSPVLENINISLKLVPCFQ